MNDNFYILIVLGMAGTILLCGGVLYFFTAYIKKSAQQKAELQKKEMEYQAQLFTAIISSQQEEQRRIGREIHDEAGSVLSSVRLKLSEALMENPAERMLNDSIAGIDKLSGIIRNISHLLSPPELELSGFHEALDSLCHSFPEQQSPLICLQDEIPGFIPKQHFQLSVALYRVMQELLTNTIKHAGASQIDIHVKNEGHTFVIDYADNGKGYNPDEINTKSLGLQNIKSRLLMIQARSMLYTSKGNGFRLVVYLDHVHIF